MLLAHHFFSGQCITGTMTFAGRKHPHEAQVRMPGRNIGQAWQIL